MADPIVSRWYNPNNSVPELVIPDDIDSPIDGTAWDEYTNALRANGYRPLDIVGSPDSAGGIFSVVSFNVSYDQDHDKYVKTYSNRAKPVLFDGSKLVVDLVKAGEVSESNISSGMHPYLLSLAATNRYVRGSQDATDTINELYSVYPQGNWTLQKFESFVEECLI